jgi:signal transduction histidine kinase
MPASRLHPRWPALLHRTRTARLRLTAVYGGLFLLSGAALVAVTYGLFERATRYKKPSLPRVPHAPAIKSLDLASPLDKTLPQLGYVQQQLTRVQQQFKGLSFAGTGVQLPTGTKPIKPEVVRDQQKLAKAQHQLASAAHQLSRAVHQVTQAGSAEAAQRGADSHQLLVDSGIALGVVVVVALLAAWLVAGRVLKPIRTITRTARRISSSNLHERLGLVGPQDELKELGDTLDELFGRLDAAFDAQRHFVANASHELRTPLTAERSLLQVALDDPGTSAAAWRSIAQELLASNDEQNQLIESLLTLASSEGGVEHPDQVDLSDVARDVLGRRATVRLALHVTETTAPAPVDGDPLLLESLVANLVDNAITHNVKGGAVDVSTGTRDGRSLVAVANTGPVVPPTEVDRLFRPFQRLDRRRLHHDGGHGLGLSIVSAIAAAHGATVTAEPFPEGGISIEVTFPRPRDRGAGDGREVRRGPGVTSSASPVLTS